jgi:hypothetical protein
MDFWNKAPRTVSDVQSVSVMQTSCVLILPFALAISLVAGPLVFQSPETATPLLELFTSEGCSSCPPADEWLGRLKDDPGLWRDFVPVAFHVDYWDHLGWRDPFAQASFTRRQRAYAASWGSRTVYTPGFVWQGSDWRNWRGGKRTIGAGKAGSLKVVLEKSRLTVDYDQAGMWDVHAAILGCGIVVPVRAGENSGRRLAHDFVALTYAEAAARVFPVVIELPQPAEQAAEKFALAVWISPRGKPAPVQATGGWLPR